MAQPQILEGTVEELQAYLKRVPAEQRFRLVPLPPELDKTVSQTSRPKKNAAQERENEAPRRLSGMGKFAGIIPSSEEFMRQKQEEIELEERKFRR